MALRGKGNYIPPYNTCKSILTGDVRCMAWLENNKYYDGRYDKLHL